MPLNRIAPDEFVRRLRASTEQTDKRFAFFLGAGCFVTSGVPAAGALVKDDWLPRLRSLRAPQRSDLEAWAREQFPKYDPDHPAGSYGAVMEELFLNNTEERQREVERLCEGRFPGFGYAVTAGLMALDGGCFNVALTTNFDDLIGDALYLFTNARPLVIPHESLAGFIRATRTRPLVVKVHGDHRLSPMNTFAETAELKRAIAVQVRALLQDRGLIFLGYGGNDRGVEAMLNELPADALPLGVYWVGSEEPNAVITPWLESRLAVWVEHSDFDQLMVLVKDTFGLPHPDRGRFERIFDKYVKTYNSLAGRIASLPDTEPDTAPLKAATRRIDESFPPWQSVEMRARRWTPTDRAQARDIFERALTQYPRDSRLLSAFAKFLSETAESHEQAEKFYLFAIDADPKNGRTLSRYASFLWMERRDLDRAEKLYLSAIDADPNNAPILCDYACFLSHERKDLDRAEKLYLSAIDADPKNGRTLSDYASFLRMDRKDLDRAEEVYRRAAESDPNDANILRNYADFLWIDRNDLDRAEELYRRAIESDPYDAYTLVSSAVFLWHERKDLDRAEEFYRRAIESEPYDAYTLISYADFLWMEREALDRAEELYRRAVESSPNGADTLISYADFLRKERNDLDRAEQFYRRAVESGPNHANTLVSYADFLRKERNDLDRAEEFYRRAIEAEPNDANTLVSYADFLRKERKDLDRAEEFFRRAVESDPNDANILRTYADFLREERTDLDRADPQP